MRRALIIDDSLTVRMDLQELFREHAFEVSACESLKCAREELAQTLPDVVVLDLHLPDGDGIEFLRELRSTPLTAKLGVILLSAQADVEQQLRGLSIGADEYVAKPYDAEQLVERADSLARRKRAATVLVIDDSLTYRERLRDLVESAGYSVITAKTGEEGLHLAAVRRPTAIIVDYMLPGIQGDSVIRRIRQEGKLRRTPTLLLTASEDPADQLRALEAGADTFVRKDQDSDVLLACLNSIIRSASTPSALEDSEGMESERVVVVGDSSFALQLSAELKSPEVSVLAVRTDSVSRLSNLRQVDCLVLDARELHVDVIEAEIQAIKRDAERVGTRVIVVGEDDLRHLMITYMNAGADDYVDATAGIQVIAARVSAHLRRKRLEDENRGIREHILRNRLVAETQKELARAAASRNQELQQLAETIPALVWTCNPEGKLTYSNSRWHEYTGMSQEQTQGEGWIQALHPEDRQSTEEAFRNSMRTGAAFEAEYRIRNAKGTYRWFIGRALPVRLNGAIARWFGTAIDIEDRRQAEEALRRSEKIAATGRLAASIAHEINNPLAAVVNMLYLLPFAIKQDTQKALEYVDMAQQEISRVSHITRQTLAFYRDSGSAVPIDVCPLVDEILRIYASKARDAGVILDPQMDCKRHIEGYTGEVRQVVSNLVANAIEASPAGNRVTVRVCPWWDLRNGRSGVRISVHDRGRGIPRDFLPQLFKPFATTKGQKGTGLGLWVSQSIVEKHAGHIRVRSCTCKDRSGTSFTVFLPSAAHTPSPHEDEIRELFGDVGRELLE